MNIDTYLSVRLIADILGIDRMHIIIDKDLGVRKICAKSLSKMLRLFQKIFGMH